MTRPVEVVRQIAPTSQASYLAAFESGDTALQQHEINTADRLAHFLAQVLHESGGLMLGYESLNYSAKRLVQVFGPGRHSAAIAADEAERLAHDERAIAERIYGLGNPRKAQELGNNHLGDGFIYRGRGLMQTTGRFNYRRIGQLCGVDFENNPDLVLSAEHALKPALVAWSEAGLNIYADNNDLLAISRAINCGSPKSKRVPNGMRDRATWFAKVRPLIDPLHFGPIAIAATGSTPQVKRELPWSEAPPASITDLLGERVLRVGDEGPVVRAVQLALARLGYPLRGSGSFGGRTLTAAKDFQAAHGLEVDGEIGAETAKAIDRALAELASAAAPGASALADLTGNRILRVGDAGPIVQAAQLALARLRYPLKGLGTYGPATERAVRDFQGRHTLEADGELGPETAKAIDRALTAITTPEGSVEASGDTAISSIVLPSAKGSLADLVARSVLAIGDNGPVVQALQLALVKLGYSLKGTGYFGGATEAAVADFQERRGLEVDGEVGLETALAIDQALALTGSQADSPQSKESDMRPAWVVEGLKWLDVQETGGRADNPVILQWAEDEGGAIATYYKHDSIPWCALFANMVLTKLEIRGTETLRALDWNDWGQRLAGPAVGAFAPMKRQGGGHIAIVIGRDKHGNLMCLGGNQSDAVNVVAFSGRRPLSFRWPLGEPLPLRTGLESLPLMRSDGRVSIKES